MRKRKLLANISRLLTVIMFFSIFTLAPSAQAAAAGDDESNITVELNDLITQAESLKAGNEEFTLQISYTSDGSDVNQAFPWMYADEFEEFNDAIEFARNAKDAETEQAITRLQNAISLIKSDGSDPYFRLDPGLGSVPIKISAPSDNWNTRRPLDNRVPSDFAGSTVEMTAYPFADSEGKADVLQINYKHNGTSTFGGISVEAALEPEVEIPEGSTIEFDVYYPKSAQGKYMRWRISTDGRSTTDSYLREYDYTNLNPDWVGSWNGETWLKAHHSVVATTGSASKLILELHGESARPAETGILLVSDIKITAPDPDVTPLPEVVNTENQSEVTPLKDIYNTENGLFMVGSIGTGSVTGTRARHYEIFVDGNNLKADSTHPTGPNWLKSVDGAPLNGATAEPGLAEYRFPTNSYLAIRDSGEEGEYKMHGHVLAWYNQAPSWMRQIIPEHLASGYTGTAEFYGLGNGVTDTVKVDKDTARRVQYNHIMYVMRHFLTTDEKYGSSEERGIIPFHSWDVLNEEVHESRHSELIPQDPNSWRTSLKHTNWLVAMSDDEISGDLSEHYIYLLFKYAHIAAPNAQMAEAYKANYDSLPEYMKLDGHDDAGSIDAYVTDNPPKLTYNDYGTATRSKARTIYNMVRDLNTEWESDPLYDGRPLIEVVGFQGHDSVNKTLASDNQYAMSLFASLVDEGLLSGISFSEFDLKLLTDAPGGGATAPAALNIRQSDALGYQYALMYKLFTRFAPYIDHIISWGVSGSGWQGSYVLFDSQSNANAGYYAAANPDRYILGHSYLDDYFDGEYEKLQDDYVIDLGDLGTYIPKGSVMSSIDITTAPSKTVYTEGESFDPTGMVVTATYANGNKKAITDYTISPDGALTPDVTSITVTYTENGVTKTAALPITVNLDLSRVEKVEEQINGLPSVEDIVIDNEEHIKTVADAKAAYDALSDDEKSMVSKSCKDKLDALLAALVAYDIVKGDGSKWQQGSDESLSFTANGPFSKFMGIKIDGNEVDASCYEVKSGSTIIALKPSYLATLSAGKHTITVIYIDGETTGEFTIADDSATEDNSKTGDKMDLIFWTMLFIISGSAGAVLMLYSQKKRRIK